MAQTLAVGQILQLEVFTKSGPQLGINVVHHEVTAVSGTPLPTDLELATYWVTVAFGTGLAAKYSAILHAGASFEGVGVTILQPFRQIPQYWPTSVTGTGGADPLPLQCSGLIRKKGALPGRHGRGRVYLPFPPLQLSAQDGQGYPSPTAGYITAANFIGTALLTPVTGGTVGTGSVDLNPIIYNRALPGASIVVDGYLTQPVWATQRRRSESGRPNTLPF